MKRLLVVTAASPSGRPSQGTIVEQRMRKSGVDTSLISPARTGVGRLLDVAFRGLFLARTRDVVLVDVFGGRAFAYESLAILYGKLWRKRVVVMVHGGRMPTFASRWPLWTRLVLSVPDLVLTPHDFLRTELSRRGVRVDRVLPNFIELQRYAFLERSLVRPRFLYLRGSHHIYNPQLVLRAFARVQRQRPDASLSLAGFEPARAPDLTALAARLGLRNVRFLGLLPKRAIPRVAADHDIYIQANRVENMPVTVIEMWACGVPVIATRAGGITYLVRDGLDALLVDSEDDAAFAAQCLRLLDDPDLARMLSRNGRARAEAFDWTRVEAAWREVLALNGNDGDMQ